MAEKSTYFVSADDDFLSTNAAREIFERLCKGIEDDMSKEVVDCSANSASDVEKACASAIEGARTMSLFGGKKVIWMRGVNFISDSRAGKSEGAKAAVVKLLDFLEKLDAEVAGVVISASPVDRRSAAFKRLQKFAECKDFKLDDSSDACAQLIKSRCQELNVKLEYGAAETLAAIVAGSPRMALSEIDKLAAYVGFGGNEISEKDVIEMVPIFGEGDFFEIANAFYSADLNLALASLKRYFFTNKNASARPIITILQKQNSLLIQLRALMDDGVIPASERGVSKFAMEAAAGGYAEMFKDFSVKSSYSVFSQNSWYAGQKLAPMAARFGMKKLLAFQTMLAKSFEELLSASGRDEAVMRDLFVRCLSK